MPDGERETINVAAKFGAKLKALTLALRAATEENTQLKAQATGLTTERDQLRQQVLTPDAKDKKIADLTATIRTGKHKARFAELAKAAGANEKSLEALYKLSEHRAETDEPDDDALTALVNTVREQLPDAFAKPADGAGNPPAPEPKKIPGGGRGGQNGGQDGTIITADQRVDPKFMLNPANQKVIQAAAKEGRFR